MKNVLERDDPPCTRDVYDKLSEAGYSVSEAKDKIGAVALTEIYDLLKNRQSFDEGKYQENLEQILQRSLDSEDDHSIQTG